MKLRTAFCTLAMAITFPLAPLYAQVEDFASVVSSGVYSVYPNYYSSSSVSGNSGTSSATNYVLQPNFSKAYSPSRGSFTITPEFDS